MHDADQIQTIAADWVARQDRAALSTEQQAMLGHWLQADARHQGAYLRAQAVYARTARLQASAPAAPAKAGRPRLRHRGWMAAAACVAVVAVCVVVAEPWLQPGQRYASGPDAIDQVHLSDGSTITLDVDSRVRVHYSARHRDVALLQGKALFDVAHDPARPFVVSADQTSVTAVGTSFSVETGMAGAQTVEVVVRQGVVDVKDVDHRVAPARLSAEHLAFADPRGGIRVVALDPEGVRRELAWLDRMLAFKSDTLSSAAARFARYSRQRIVIDDPQVGGLRVTGLYAASDASGFAHHVAQLFGLELQRHGTRLILARPAQHAAAADRPAPAPL